MRASAGRLVLLFAVAASACGRERSPNDGAAARAGSGGVIPDTSTQNGFAVRRHRDDAFERAPKFGMDPNALVTVTSDADGTFDFADADRVVLLSDGRVVTVDPFASRILVFGPDGRGQRRLGRQGSGPGELVRIDGIARIDGDTILVADGGNARFSWWVADGALVAEHRFPDDPVFGGFISIDGVLTDGSVVLHSNTNAVSDSVTEKPMRPASSIHLVSARDGTMREVARVPGREAVRTALTRARPMVEPVRFGRRTLIAAWDSTVAVANNDGYRIERLRADGSVESRLLAPRKRTPVPRSVHDSLVRLEVSRVDSIARRNGVDPAPRRQLALAAPYADSLPSYDEMYVTPDRSTLWVFDARLPADTTWSATGFRADGAIVGRLVAGGPGRPVAFGNDRVVLRSEDADGVAVLRVHRIVPR